MTNLPSILSKIPGVPYGARPDKQGVDNHCEAARGDDSDEQILLKLHNALDLTEAYLKRIDRADSTGSTAIGLLLELRRNIITQTASVQLHQL